MKKVIILCLIIISLFVFCSCTPNLTLEEEYELLISEKTPIVRISVIYAFDVDKLEILVGFADYVFVGKVTGFKGTINDASAPLGLPAGMPDTKYSVEVVENIKGNLVTDIEILKRGGLSENRKSKEIYPDDIMPQIGEHYIFVVAARNDGELYASGKNSNIKIENPQNFHEDAEYKKVIEAYENEVVFDRDRNKSIYEQE
jgi:hypothetical protein